MVQWLSPSEKVLLPFQKVLLVQCWEGPLGTVAFSEGPLGYMAIRMFSILDLSGGPK